MKHNSLDSLAKELTRELTNALGQDNSITKLIAQTVSDKVESEVYSKHDPKSYKRRGKKNGLADPENVERVSFGSANSTIQMVYENITEGADNLKGKELTDVIEEGDTSAWANPDGVWALPRPFIEPAIEELQESNKLRDQVVAVLRKSGLDVK